MIFDRLIIESCLTNGEDREIDYELNGIFKNKEKLPDVYSADGAHYSEYGNGRKYSYYVTDAVGDNGFFKIT